MYLRDRSYTESTSKINHFALEKKNFKYQLRLPYKLDDITHVRYSSQLSLLLLRRAKKNNGKRNTSASYKKYIIFGGYTQEHLIPFAELFFEARNNLNNKHSDKEVEEKVRDDACSCIGVTKYWYNCSYGLHSYIMQTNKYLIIFGEMNKSKSRMYNMYDLDNDEWVINTPFSFKEIVQTSSLFICDNNNNNNNNDGDSDYQDDSSMYRSILINDEILIISRQNGLWFYNFNNLLQPIKFDKNILINNKCGLNYRGHGMLLIGFKYFKYDEFKSKIKGISSILKKKERKKKRLENDQFEFKSEPKKSKLYQLRILLFGGVADNNNNNNNNNNDDDDDPIPFLQTFVQVDVTILRSLFIKRDLENNKAKTREIDFDIIDSKETSIDFTDWKVNVKSNNNDNDIKNRLFDVHNFGYNILFDWDKNPMIFIVGGESRYITVYRTSIYTFLHRSFMIVDYFNKTISWRDDHFPKPFPYFYRFGKFLVVPHKNEDIGLFVGYGGDHMYVNARYQNHMWAKVRLIFIGYLKNIDNKKEFFHRLPKDILLLIVEMLMAK